MRNEPIESVEHAGFKVSVHYDEDPLNPREDWEGFGKMICFHKRYNLGDKHQYNADDFGGWDEIEEYLVKECGAVIILPLSLYDHSGITMSVGRASGWDSGQVGFIYATREDILEWFPIKVGRGYKPRKLLTKAVLDKAEKVLRGEVETYDRYLTGMVYGYTVEDYDGEVLESCWGFFGEESEVLEEGKRVAESLAEDTAKELHINA